MIFKEYRKLILSEIKRENIRENNNKEYYIDEPEKLKGRHIISFEVDFDFIRNYIESIIEYINSKNNNKNGLYLPINDDIINEYIDIITNNKTRHALNIVPDYDLPSKSKEKFANIHMVDDKNDDTKKVD